MNSKFMKKAGAAIMAAAMAINGTAISISSVVAADAAKYEFEDGTMTGTVSAFDDTAASGGKVARMEDDGTVSVEVEVPSTGMYAVTIYAQGIGGSKIQNLAVNDVDQGQISIGDAGYEPISMTVKLNEGKNTVTISKSWGWTNFDYLTVAPAELSEIKATQTTCCDVNATDETRALMSYLASVYGNGIISGQQEIYQYGPHDYEQEFEYLNDLTGHYPAIRGFDYGNRCCVLFGQNDDGSTDRAIDWVKNKNGIATASFHLNVPNDFESYTLGSTLPFDQTTYSQNTDFSPSKAATVGTKENEYYLDALKVLAGEFKKLEAEGVPVMWRPLHEAEGGGGETGSWFWWGREGSDAYKDLWKYTYKVLTEDFGCHNLIWVWNSYNYEYSQDWYPGDEYVDIIGYDKYNCTDWSTGSAVIKHNDSAISSTFYGIMERYDSKKMVAMAENDSFSTVDNITAEKAGWLYFMTWYDGGSPDINFVSDPRFNTEQDTIDMYQSEYCITLDELPADLYTKETPKPDPITTTTVDPAQTTTTTTEADPTKNYGKVKYDKTKKSYAITLPEAAKDFYITVELPDGVEYANGGLGVSIELDGEYYWANIQWEASKSGDVKVNVLDNLFNITLGTEEVEDEALLEKIKAKLGTSTSYEGQIWYAQKDGESTATDGVSITGAYIPNGGSDTTTTVTDVIYGDANDDGLVNIADATAIVQFIANGDKYPLSEQGYKNADCCNPGDGVTGADAYALQLLEVKSITELPYIDKAE